MREVQPEVKLEEDKIQKYEENKSIVNALHKLADLARLSGVNSETGELWLHDGTLDALVEVIALLTGGKSISPDKLSRS